MADIWTPENRFKIWRDIEVFACEAMAEIGMIPKASAENIAKNAPTHFTPEDTAKIDEIERTTKHDVIAFLTHLATFIGEDSRFVHQGMTSSDVLDTCFSVQLKQASELLLADLDKLLETLKKRAFEHKNTLTIGRSHGTKTSYR